MNKEVIIRLPVPIFEADIVENKLKFFDHERKAMARWISTFKNGTKLDIVIRKHTKKVTNLQRRYYRGVVVPILADYFGHDNFDNMNEDLKLKFNPVESKVTPGEIIGGTTINMSTEEFFSKEDSFVNRINRWAAEEFGLYIPPPKKSEKG